MSKFSHIYVCMKLDKTVLLFESPSSNVLTILLHFSIEIFFLQENFIYKSIYFFGCVYNCHFSTLNRCMNFVQMTKNIC